MASPYQQQAFQRKLFYLGAVVLLLLASLLWRKYVVEAQAQELALTEQSRGDVELVGSAVRLGMSGSRGLVTCALWIGAIEKQKKNQWNELELIVRSLTKLQPHFITPWLFQSWNLAYNVSVESDRIRDKYFYVSRGVQLLAHGERQNRFHPDLRREVGFYTQHKVCQSDENNTMRSLFQLSCIAPADRDPDVLAKRDERGRILEINWPEFEAFCKAHPHLVRRLHSPPLPYDVRREHRKFRCATAEDVIEFLADNMNVPSLFVDKEQSAKDFEQRKHKENDLDRFPVLPEQATEIDPGEWTQAKMVRDAVPDDFDAYQVARAWYTYSQEPLPPPAAIPGDSEKPTDRVRQRLPRAMSSVIFRTAPARAQTYIAERLQEEGWYDNEPFAITGWFQTGPFSADRPVEVGGGRVVWSREAWERSRQMWREMGLRNHLMFEEAFQQKDMEDRAQAFRKAFGLGPYDPLPLGDPPNLDEEQKRNLFAARFMLDYAGARSRSNFHHFWVRSGVESQMKTVTARKRIYQAEQLRLVAQAPLQALEQYEHPESLAAWKQILEDPRNLDFREDSLLQEWTYDVQLKYLRLYRQLHGANLARDLALSAYLGQSAAAAPLAADWALLGPYSRPELLPELKLGGPFDKDSKGKELIPEGVRNAVEERRDLRKPPAQPPQPAQPPSAPEPKR